MTHDELIRKVAAKAIHEHLCRRDVMQYLDNDENCEGLARAAISVIAPAVLRDALGEMTVLEIAAAEAGMTDYVNAFRDANQAVRALKTRYE